MTQIQTRKKHDNVILGGGCFWCLEAVYKRVEGVLEVTSGYAGGFDKQPTYKKVCQGEGGHAEVVNIKFNSAEVSLEQLLSLFFVIHDPTTLNRQGNDCGIQYRSIIGYQDHQQEQLIKIFLNEQESCFSDKIVTETALLNDFYPAEVAHKDYYDLNKSQPYCQMIISPKIEKLLKWKTQKEIT